MKNTESRINERKRTFLKALGAGAALGAISHILAQVGVPQVLDFKDQRVYIEPRSFVGPYDYIIFGEDTDGDGVNDIIYAKNGKTGQIEFQGTDAAEVIQKAIDSLDVGGLIHIKEGIYHITKEILIQGKTNIILELSLIHI